MARPLSTLALQELFASESNEVLLVLFKFSHSDWSSDVFFVNNTETITSGGDDYTSYPINAMFHSTGDTDGSMAIDCVERDFLALLRGAAGKDEKTEIELSIIFASQPSTILLSQTYKILNLSCDKATINVTMSRDSIKDEPYPSRTFNVNHFAGLWRS